INLRTLAKASQTTTATLASSVGTVRNLGKNVAFVCQFIRRQTRLSLAQDCAQLKTKDDPASDDAAKAAAAAAKAAAATAKAAAAAAQKEAAPEEALTAT